MDGSIIKKNILEQFMLKGEPVEMIPYGNGHINETYRLTNRWEDGFKRYIFQKINQAVFHNPPEVMENIVAVTNWLKKKITENGGDPKREAMNVVYTAQGKSYYLDEEGEYWRIFDFIEDAVSYEQVVSNEDFYQSAVAFGNFQRLLTDYPAHTLYETIPDFHNTGKRYQTFLAAAEADSFQRAAAAAKEISFVREHKDLAFLLMNMLQRGELPLRVTHNDTKLNNIMIDNASRQGICVIDLDTVMPGLSLNDFGDSIRFGANTASEDEQDLSKVQCDLELFDLYTRGYIEGCGGKLTEKELDMLPAGAIVMTYECGIRFLTDYLSGDCYFRIHRMDHNLERCRTQFKLVEDMLEKKEQMEEIINKYR